MWLFFIVIILGEYSSCILRMMSRTESCSIHIALLLLVIRKSDLMSARQRSRSFMQSLRPVRGRRTHGK